MNLFEINRNKKDSIIDFVKTKFADHRMQMVNYHRNWALQLAWTRGHQHVDYNKQTKQWVEHVTQPWQASVSSNFMLPIVLDNVSRLLSLNAQWEVLPATPAEEDIQIANTATKIARDAWKRYRMRQNLIRVLFWQATTGNGFLKVGWDAETGEEKEYRKDSLDNNAVTQFMEVFGIAEESETITLKEGELFVHPVSPFNIAVERTIDIFDESPYVIESQIRPLDWVTAKFGNKWKEKLSESDH